MQQRDFTKNSHLRKCKRQTLYMWWQNKTLSNAAKIQTVTGINSGTNCAKERSKCFPYRTVKMKRRWSIWGSCVYLFCQCKVTETVRLSLWDSLRSVSSTNSVTVAYWAWQIIWKWKRPEGFFFNGNILLYSHSQVSFYSLSDKFVTNCHFPLFHFCFRKVLRLCSFSCP